jgi:hypothetical protein
MSKPGGAPLGDLRGRSLAENQGESGGAGRKDIGQSASVPDHGNSLETSGKALSPPPSESILTGCQTEELSALLNRYLTEMSDVADKHLGTVDTFFGDAAMVYFGDPRSKGAKADAVACVRMTIEMQERVQELKQEWLDPGLEEATAYPRLPGEVPENKRRLDLRFTRSSV